MAAEMRPLRTPRQPVAECEIPRMIISDALCPSLPSQINHSQKLLLESHETLMKVHVLRIIRQIGRAHV